MSETFLNTLSTIILKFSHQEIIIPLVIVGYIWFNRGVFYGAICLVLLSMLANVALKITFKVPLAPHLGKEGYAFPSGHMQLATVLYGWLIYKIPNTLLRMGLVILIALIGFSLIQAGYHDFKDILAAMGSALLLITVFVVAQKNLNPKNFFYFPLLFALTALWYIFTVQGTIPQHVWLAFYALMGFVLSDRLFAPSLQKTSTQEKIFTTILTFALVFALQLIFTHPSVRILPPYLNQLPWVLIGFALPMAPVLVRLFTKNSCLNKKS